jgi:hypothetical protein
MDREVLIQVRQCPHQAMSGRRYPTIVIVDLLVSVSAHQELSIYFKAHAAPQYDVMEKGHPPEDERLEEGEATKY